MNKEKKIALLLVKVIIAIHFLALFLFCLPDGLLNDGAKQVVSSYANPLFQGRWNLFAPDPPKRHKEILYRVNNEPWKNLVAEIEAEHNAVRIGSSTKMYHIVQNASHYLWEDYYDFSGDDIKESVGYGSMQHLVSQFVLNESGTAFNKNCEMALVIKSVKGFNGEEVKTDTIHFPEFQIESNE